MSLPSSLSSSLSSPRLLLLPLLLSSCGLAGGGLDDPECQRLNKKMQSEYDAMKTCEVDADCGTVLMGTGCTTDCDRVVRTDADTRAFDEALQEANALSCVLTFDIRCDDCPSTEGFICDEGVCDWYYPEYGPG